jgi:hypothetical protein
MRSPARTILALTVVSLVTAACGAAATPAPTATPTQAAIITPGPTDAPTVRPTPTPMQMTDGVGPEHVTGTGTMAVTKEGTETVVGDVTQIRGQEMTGSGTGNDPRLNGTSHITLNADVHGPVVAMWGTSRIENAGGTWEGTWTGASWNDSAAWTVTTWFIGTGGYAGWTYYSHQTGTGVLSSTGDGIIFQGSPPTP